MNFDNEQKAHEAIAQTAGYRLEKNYRFAVSLTSGNTLPESSSNRTVCFVRTAHDQNKEVSYIVSTQGRLLVTEKPPEIIIGKLDEIATLT